MFRNCICRVIRITNYNQLFPVTRSLHKTAFVRSDNEFSDTKVKNEKRKVKETVELIILIDTNNKILGLKSKKEAEMLAQKLNLILQKTNDPRFGDTHPAFKMVSSTDLFAGDISEVKKSTTRTLKKMPIKSNIADNDLQIKVKTIRKWLEKDCEVHIAVTSKGDTPNLRNSVMKKIQEYLGLEVRVLNVRHTEDVLKFILIPPKEKKTNSVKQTEKE